MTKHSPQGRRLIKALEEELAHARGEVELPGRTIVVPDEPMRDAPIISYPAELKPQLGGGFAVTFPDLPDAIADGVDEQEACEAAIDCLAGAIVSSMEVGALTVWEH